MSPEPTPPIDRFIQIDEEGFFMFDEVRVTDDEYGRHLLKNIEKSDNEAFVTDSHGTRAYVEAFDEPYVAKQVYKLEGPHWEILMPYGFKARFSLDSLTLDEWDRFHGHTDKGISFVFARSAQAEFFNLVDEFDDDSITVGGRKINIPSWLVTNKESDHESFWSHIYQTEKPGWELDAPAKPLRDILPQLKIPKSRILVLGAGSCNDAAYFASLGHVVTAVDISPEAINQARQKYGDQQNLTILEQDMFELGEEHNQAYDIIFEHTCYCAINPSRRNDLVRLWKRLLAEQGHLLGIFFTMDRPVGPPFGGSEWEIRQRLKKHFDFLYWTRWQKSGGRRMGKELVVYARVK